MTNLDATRCCNLCRRMTATDDICVQENCPCHTEAKESWESEFDEKFPAITINDFTGDSPLSATFTHAKPEEIKSFIRTAIATSYEEGAASMRNKVQYLQGFEEGRKKEREEAFSEKLKYGEEFRAIGRAEEREEVRKRIEQRLADCSDREYAKIGLEIALHLTTNYTQL